MDPITIVIAALIVTEVLSGGLMTATATHAAKVGGQTAGKHMSASAKAAYAKRAAELSKSKTGQWRLRAEARLGRLGVMGAKAGKGVVVGAAGVTVAVAKGAAEGVKAIPAGAKTGVAWWADTTPQGRAVKAWRDSRGDTPGDDMSPPVSPGVSPRRAWQVAKGDVPSAKAELPPAPTLCGCGAPVEYGFTDCAKCGAENLAGMDRFLGEVDPMLVRAAEVQAERDRRDGTPQVPLAKTSAPEVPGGEGTGMDFDDVMASGPSQAAGSGFTPCPLCHQYHAWTPGETTCANQRYLNQQASAPEVPAGEGASMSTTTGNTDLSLEDGGAYQYVNGWAGSEAGLEMILADLTLRRDAVQASAEANRRHEVGGVEDVIGSYTAAMAAVQAAGEAHSAHTTALHAAHDGALEATSGSTVESHQDYSGSR